MDNNLDQAIQKTWLRTESRTIRPFLFSDELLKSVAFRLTSEDEFSELESVHKEELDRVRAYDNISLEQCLKQKRIQKRKSKTQGS
jgi:hypothetical protein